jgi:hypothetical protein
MMGEEHDFSLLLWIWELALPPTHSATGPTPRLLFSPGVSAFQ